MAIDVVQKKTLNLKQREGAVSEDNRSLLLTFHFNYLKIEKIKIGQRGINLLKEQTIRFRMVHNIMKPFQRNLE